MVRGAIQAPLFTGDFSKAATTVRALMKITLGSSDPLKLSTDLLVLFATDAEAFPKGKAASGLLGQIDATLGNHLRAAAAQEKFSAKIESTLELSTLGRLPADRVAVLGLGPASAVNHEVLRQAAGRAAKLARRVSAKRITVVTPGKDPASEVRALAEGLALGAYQFDRYLSDKKASPEAEATLLLPRSPDAALRAALARALHLAQSVCAARDLVNEPAGELTPARLAAAAQKLAREAGLKIEVLDRPQIERLKMGMFLGVAQGSNEPPKLIHVWHPGSGKNKGSGKSSGGGLAFIGKAITFDSGGLSLKTNEGMLEMKTDMAGSAAVLGAMREVAEIDPPFPVHAYMGACENMPSGTAYKLGDVLKARNGRTVEINNTVAEGRLVLGDMLTYAAERMPAAMVDVATLTGACMVALGHWTAGAFGQNAPFMSEVLEAAGAAGEDIWQLPMVPWVKESLKSDLADMRNTGDRLGGAISAAHFLREFTGDIPWVHLDIAGPSSAPKERGYLPKGGTGFGVRTLAALVERRK